MLAATNSQLCFHEVNQKQQCERNVSKCVNRSSGGATLAPLIAHWVLSAGFMLFVAIKLEHKEHLQLLGNYHVTGAVLC